MAALAAIDLRAFAHRPATAGRPAASRAVRHGLTIVGGAYALFFLVAHLLGAPTDAYEYWSVPLDQVYLAFTEHGPGYAYPPPFAILMAPLTTISYDAFYGGWVAMMAIAAFWLVRPLSWVWRVPLLLLIVPELLTGNYHLILATALVVGFEHAGASAILLLSKVTPGISVLWFVARREWRAVVVAASVTVAVIAVSIFIQPELWGRWWAAITSHAFSTGPATVGLPLATRLPIAIALIVFAARTNRRWLVPIGALLAMPWIYLQSFAILLAIVRLRPEATLVDATEPQAVVATPAERAATAAAPSS